MEEPDILFKLAYKTNTLGIFYKVKKINFAIITENDNITTIQAQKTDDFVIIGGTIYPLSSFIGNIYDEELNPFFKEVKDGKTTFTKANVVFDDIAAKEIKTIELSKLSDRIAERIWFSGNEKFKLPTNMENLISTVIIAVIIIMLLWVFLSQFPAVADSIYGQATKIAQTAAINATNKVPIKVG